MTEVLTRPTTRELDELEEPEVLPPPEPVPCPEAELLEAAADLLESKGWIRNHLSSYEGYCVVGALSVAAGRGRVYPSRTPSMTLRNALRHLAGVLGYDITKNLTELEAQVTNWNDDVAAGRQVVTHKLRETAAKLTR